MNDNFRFENEINDRDIKYYKRFIITILISTLFMCAIFLMNIFIAYQGNWFNALTAGMLLFCCIFNFQQLLFCWDDYKIAKRFKEIYKQFEIEEKINNNLS